MSRIKPESLPKPKKVSKTQAKSLYNQFTATGNSKYDVYVEAAKELNPGEALSVMELPENVITSIQKKFRERGLTTAAGFYAVSKTIGSEEKGKKSLLIGRYATKPAARKSTARKSTRSASKKTATTSKSPTTSRTARSKTATTSKAVKASSAKKATRATSPKSVKAKSDKKTTSKATASKSRTRKPAAKKASTNGAATTTA